MPIGSDRVSIGNDRVSIGSGQFLSGLISQGSGVSSCVLRKSLAAKEPPDGHTKVCDRVDFVCASCMHRDIRVCIVYPSGVIGSAPRLLRVFIGSKMKFTATFRFGDTFGRNWKLTHRVSFGSQHRDSVRAA